jgi:hypothetical protein
MNLKISFKLFKILKLAVGVQSPSIETLTKEANHSSLHEGGRKEARRDLDRLIKQNGKKFGDEDAE